ncbi:PIG-L family deacetylase [Microbacterium sp. W1N]|uniref:PIG-L family deacetylase n=1 Tax=Microbacterium festucae TaxID=2977531 RepID=UPI0021BF93C0|nr:PIG-L family deacetylase [Microbacterium festucae]MCT9821401.1 PIG-L family deacetylase [Microbacterium festucae]
MSVAFDHREAGTAEADWQAAAPWAGSPALSLDVARVVVVAAHPDDETLGAGGLIAAARRRGLPVTVLVLTDGDASHPGDPAIADIRRGECVHAVGALGAGIDLRLRALTDGGLREQHAEVHAAIAAVLAEGEAGRTLLAVPWWGDGHRDHRIAGEAGLALRATGARVVGYPIWLWHWSPATDLDTADWLALPLEPAVRAAKERAIEAHRSQLVPSASGEPPIVHAGMRSHFARDVEVFIAAPRAAGRGHDAAWFDAFYARHDDPWGFETRWYEQRKRAVLLSTLPRERYDRALELGCATGLLTAGLAGRAARVTGVDIAAEALQRARARGLPDTVELRQLDTPAQWPAGRFDLVVLSELGYYWSPDDLAAALHRIHASLEPGGELVACHWRPPIEGCTLDGDQVHAAIVASGLFERITTHLEAEFVLEVFRPVAARR